MLVFDFFCYGSTKERFNIKEKDRRTLRKQNTGKLRKKENSKT
jgi:hypothetical protein